MPVGAVAWAMGCAVALLVALHVHRRIVGFLPEDPPGTGRKRHARPTPLVGFVPAALACVACALADRPWLAAAVATAAAAGALDDFRKPAGGIDWRPKALLLLAATAAASVDWGARHGAADTGLGTWAAVVLVLFCTTNALNFLDNTDGLATALGATCLLLASDAAGLGLELAALWLAFLPFNWPRARAFLGDAGAYAIGLCGAAIALDSASMPTGAAAYGGLDPRLLLAPLAVPALDFVQVVLARLWLGFAPWIGDRRHLSHLALNLGVPAPCIAPLFVLLAVGAQRAVA